ncbi:MAG: NADH-quinone oxidoreductase subunit NuoH [Coriobacteriia bacterium]|nr:NADH-quinone oxidoreductase subunit NuoH [Coriobacteriia bacterium]
MTGYLGGVVFGLASGVLIAMATILGVYGERKVAAWIQMRIGPQETGPAGSLQLIADLLKLLLKEDITPRRADVRPFKLAPFLVFAPVAMSVVVIPFARGWAPLDTSVGMLFFLAVPSLSVLGVLVAGWSSGNTYATIGGLRGAAQMISYELPRTLSVLSIVVLAGSLRPVDVVSAWRWWWIPLNVIGFLVYYIASIAECNRGPFDIPEAESELVAGYFADYSGIRWGIFMMTEYGAVLSASLFAAAIYLGTLSWLPPVLGIPLFIAVTLLLGVSMIWVKWTFPRMRSDQLMALAWKVLTPMALVQLAIVGVVIAWL